MSSAVPSAVPNFVPADFYTNLPPDYSTVEGRMRLARRYVNELTNIDSSIRDNTPQAEEMHRIFLNCQDEIELAGEEHNAHLEKRRYEDGINSMPLILRIPLRGMDLCSDKVSCYMERSDSKLVIGVALTTVAALSTFFLVPVSPVGRGMSALGCGITFTSGLGGILLFSSEVYSKIKYFNLRGE